MRAHTIAALLVACVLGSGSAHAGPAFRIGLTGALADEGAPGQYQVGPMVGLGARLGPALLEVDYAYLSFMEADVSDGGMHRVGLNLRADLYRDTGRPCIRRIACTRAFSVFGEIGAGLRYGQWHLDAVHRAPESDRQREVHIATGIELDNQIVPTTLGWQLGFRLALAPRSEGALACPPNTICAAVGSEPERELDLSFLIEWTFLVGR